MQQFRAFLIKLANFLVITVIALGTLIGFASGFKMNGVFAGIVSGAMGFLFSAAIMIFLVVLLDIRDALIRIEAGKRGL